MQGAKGNVNRKFAFGSAFAMAQILFVSAGTASAQTASDSDSTAALTEIVVTAQHREENLQDVPISVAVVSAAALESSGISASNALAQMIPAIRTTRAGSSGLFFIRGVGTTNASAGEEGANAFYVDGVYIADLQQTITNFNNIERIEVLKGPQGTLFGRNATGGLIHVITKEPGSETEFRGKIGYGNFDTVEGQAYISTPISDNLGWDVAFTGRYQGKGWGRNITLDREAMFDKYWGIRSKGVWRPSDHIKVALSGDYYKTTENIGVTRRVDDAAPGLFGLLAPGRYDTMGGEMSVADVQVWGLSAKVDVDLGFAELVSVSGMREARNKSSFDLDAVPFRGGFLDYFSGSRSYQQEIRLASYKVHPLAWQAGLFYLHTDVNSLQTLEVFGTSTILTAAQKTDSYAAFGEVTYSITPSTHVTGGIRYTRDQRKVSGSETPVSAAGVIGTPVIFPRPGIDPFKPTLKQSAVSYRVSLRQDLNDDVNVYASLNRGFKAGGFNLQTLSNPPYRPQFITAYEIGLKSQFFDRRLRLNLAMYHYDITDYQVRNTLNLIPFFRNAGRVKVDGLDAEFEAALTENLRLFGGVTLLNSRFADFPGAVFQYARPATCTVAPPGAAGPGVVPGSTNSGVPLTGGYLSCFGDASGNRTMQAPKFSGNIGASYMLPIGNRGEVRLNALYSYVSKYYFQSDEILFQRPYGLLNVSLEYRPVRQLGIEAWGKNIGNTAYYAFREPSGLGGTSAFAGPRTYGVSLKYEY